MCLKCKEDSRAVDITALQKEIETLTKEMFPLVNDVQMEEENGVSGSKRGSSDTDDNESNSHKKPALEAAS